ncbi:hypothetical protein RC083_16530 [Pseudoalteromonas haloplanktis]|uniref:BatD n=1 Tax=Pseudoalteromonas haloplanktis TaxID=228 RepID=A0ABU1BFS0_PSEHA|nr:hypothetical protein [Pseudoalteromonas haloplanktis]MDQ9093185.1 hypothetical protein [Pseudoalteromonas haloplanktis]
MKTPLLLMLYICLLTVAGFCYGDDTVKPKVSTLVKEPTILVGQKNTVQIKVLVPSWFTKSLYFEEVEAKNILTVPANKSAYPVSEKVAGKMWSGVTKEYYIVALKPGEFTLTIPPLKVHFMGEDSTQIVQTITPEPVTFTATIPEKARALNPVIIADSIELEQSLSIPEKLTAGQTVTRSLSVKVHGSSALFIPQLLKDTDTEFQRAYLRSPKVEDLYHARSDELLGTRQETQDTLLKTDGTLSIEPISIKYYQPSSNEIITVSVDGSHVIVKPGKLTVQQWLTRIFIIIVALLISALLIKRSMLAYKKYKESEIYQFKQLLKNLDKPNHTLLITLNQWRQRWRLHYLKNAQASKEISAITLDIEQAVYNKGNVNKNWSAQLQEHRQRFIDKKSQTKGLQTLNP